MKPYFFIISPDVFPFDILISVDESDDILLSKLKKYGIHEEDCKMVMNLSGTSRGRCVILSSNQTVIRLKSQPVKSEMIGLISHEVFHAVSFILQRIGMKLKIGYSDEAYAYLMGYLTTFIAKKLKL